MISPVQRKTIAILRAERVSCCWHFFQQISQSVRLVSFKKPLEMADVEWVIVNSTISEKEQEINVETVLASRLIRYEKL